MSGVQIGTGTTNRAELTMRVRTRVLAGEVYRTTTAPKPPRGGDEGAVR